MDNQEEIENAEEKTFAELMAESALTKDHLRPGQRVQALIVKISPEWIFIDLGSKSEGYLDRKEFLDDDGNLTVKEGDTVDVFFLTVKNNEKLFTRKISRGEAAKAFLEDAWRNGIPLEGKIGRETKGGLEVLLAGNVRAFCPFSLTGIPRGENIADYIGKTLLFKILEYAEGGRKVILSRRAILDEEKAKLKEELRKTLKEGMIVKGRVTSLHNFGAFVDIGGIQGLLPTSEIGWRRGEETASIISVGDLIDVSIMKLDWINDKITLSRKATLPDPWANIERDFPLGARFLGRVSSLTNFGAFVSLGDGIEGLIHISKLGKGKRIKHSSEVLAKGQELEVTIEAIDREKKRLSLSLTDGDRADLKDKDEEKDYLAQHREESKSATFGSLGDVMKSKNPSKTNR